MLQIALGYKTSDFRNEVPDVLYLGPSRKDAIKAAQTADPQYQRATVTPLVQEVKILRLLRNSSTINTPATVPVSAGAVALRAAPQPPPAPSSKGPGLVIAGSGGPSLNLS